jgi:arylsulfatase A-like enzyme
LGIPSDSIIGVRTEQCGFDVYERDDGMRPEGPEGFYDDGGAATYNEWLRERGYPGDNPWHDFANSARDEDGNVLSGWLLENARKPAAIKEEDSETPYMTSRAIEFMDQAGETPWCLHLSYIKPHWPYIAPAPYNDMYGPEHVIPVNRSEDELIDMHPVYANYVNNRVGQSFSRDEVLEHTIPSYMGLIKQCDDQMGRLFGYLKSSGLWDNTMIVLTSDHGDYLGDHWMGEKDLFHDCSAKIPLIIRDPSDQADARRGSECDALVESIDLAPTFLDVIGAEARPHILEGASLLPFLHGNTPAKWRDYVISENDYGISPGNAALAEQVDDPRQYMVANTRWKYIYAEGFRPMLFDLENDPNELNDLGKSAEHEVIRQEMFEALSAWARRLSQRTTMSPADVIAERKRSPARGILLGALDETEMSDAQRAFYGKRKGPEFENAPE